MCGGDSDPPASLDQGVDILEADPSGISLTQELVVT